MGDDFVIPQSLASDEVDFRARASTRSPDRRTSPSSERRLRRGRASRSSVCPFCRPLGKGLDLIQVQDLGTSGVFSMLPRNSAALVLTFDDLIDPDTINRNSIQLATGLPLPAFPFEARIFPSDVLRGRRPRRPAVPDARRDRPDDQRARGVRVEPAARHQRDRSARRASCSATRTPSFGSRRGPTRRRASPPCISNLTDHQLGTSGNGPVDNSSSSTRPVTRAFRSGGRPDLISDPFNGFLRDEPRAGGRGVDAHRRAAGADPGRRAARAPPS